MSENQEDPRFIQGKNIYLRPLMEKDVLRFTKWMNDREVTKFLTLYLPITEKAEKNWLENAINDQANITLSIVMNDGVVIGNIGISKINWKDGTAYSGCVIGEREYWGKGFGTEAKMLFLHYLFYDLGLRKISSTVLGNNPRSLAYQKKCGSKVEGALKDQIYWDGQYWDEIILGAFREDFEKIWEKEKDRYLIDP